MPALTSLVIPVFNEADSIEPLVAEIDAALGAAGVAFEIVFVDDGSTDGSFAAMERLAAGRDDVRVVKLRRNFGKAAALAHGFEAVRGDYVVTLDGDRQDDPAEIPGLIARLDEGYDLVSGWKQSRQDPLNKTVPSRFFNWTVRRTSGIPLHDFNCGLKAYRRDVVDTIHIYGEQHRYIPVVAAQAGFRVTEEPVSHRPRTAGKSKYGWQRYLRGYLDLLTVLFLGRYQHRPQHLFGGIGTLLILIGVLVELYLSVDKLVFGNSIGQRPLLLLGALFIIVGVQLLSLGLIGELIANSRARGGPDDAQVALVVGPARRARERPRRRPLAAPPLHKTPRSPRLPSPRAPPTNRDPRRRLLRHVRPRLPAQRRAHRRAARAGRLGARVPGAAAGADGGADGDSGWRRAAGGRGPRGSRAAVRAAPPPAPDRRGRGRLPGALPGAVRPRARRLAADAGSCSTRWYRSGTPSPATAVWSRPAAGRAAPCAPSTAPPSSSPTSCSPTPGRTRPTTRPRSRSLVARSPSCPWGLCRRRGPAVSARLLEHRRAGHRLPVRQVEPSARRRDRPHGGRVAARRAVPLRARRRRAAFGRAPRRDRSSRPRQRRVARRAVASRAPLHTLAADICLGVFGALGQGRARGPEQGVRRAGLWSPGRDGRHARSPRSCCMTVKMRCWCRPPTATPWRPLCGACSCATSATGWAPPRSHSTGGR